MITKYTRGDLFQSECQTKVVTVNCVGAMGKGIALTAKDLYPGVLRNYRKQCKDGLMKPASMLIYHPGGSDILLLVATKKHWVNPSKMEWVEEILQKFVKIYKEKGITSAAFPPLGAGNGQLDMDTVVELMFKYLDPLDIPIEIYYL